MRELNQEEMELAMGGNTSGDGEGGIFPIIKPWWSEAQADFLLG